MSEVRSETWTESLHHRVANMVGVATAAGLVGLLSEQDHELQVYALQQANDNIGLLWTELAGVVNQMYGRIIVPKSSSLPPD